MMGTTMSVLAHPLLQFDPAKFPVGAPPSLPQGVRPTEVFDTYWRFAFERQNIFFKRFSNQAPPWTTDPILALHKFTNAYRASDRVSQYLIRHVIYQGEQSAQELFFRIVMFKLFNKIDTWKLLEREFGVVSCKEYNFAAYDSLLTQALSEGRKIYSAAYIMPSGGVSDRKHRAHLRLLERMVAEDVPDRLQQSRSMEEAFTLLRSYPMLGDFLAYQFVTDINYSTLTNFSEMDFVVPGPGARDGLRKCFQLSTERSPAYLIRLMADIQHEQFSRLGLKFHSLFGRPLQLIDCQNLFCEVDKYARCAHPEISGITGRTRIKQKFRLTPDPIDYLYPPKWGIDVNILQEDRI